MNRVLLWHEERIVHSLMRCNEYRVGFLFGETTIVKEYGKQFYPSFNPLSTNELERGWCA
jgi:hypothetical protein